MEGKRRRRDEEPRDHHRSRKRRERSNTVRSLHRTTKAAPSSNAKAVDIGGGGNVGVRGVGASSFLPRDLIRDNDDFRRRRRKREDGGHLGMTTSSSSDASIPSYSDVVIVVVGSDVDANLVIEVKRADLVKSLRRTLQTSCEAAGFVPPIYTWERWQSRCKLFELLHPTSSSSSMDMITTAAGRSMLDEVLPCTGRVDDGCVSDLVRGGCDMVTATTIASELGLAAANAASELRAYAHSLILPPTPQSADEVPRCVVVVGGGVKNDNEGGDGIVGGGEGRDGDDGGRRVKSEVSVDDHVGTGVGEVMSNRQRKRIKLHRQRAMRGGSAAARIAVSVAGGGRGSSLLEEEIAKHAVRVQSHRHSVDFSILSDGGRRLLKLNHSHYEKLRRLMTGSCVGGHCGGGFASSSSRMGGSGGASPCDAVSESDFHKLVYCVLSRYHSVLGHGFQMALGEHAFDVLRDWFDVRFECFASPLNCTCENFASAFPLTDRYFGARGNFFSLRPKCGSFEANPPFIAEIMSAMVTHMHELLRDATGPMSFVVIVPGWLDDPSWAALTASSFKCAFFLVAAADHGFCDGAQHQRQDRFRESTYDTGVFVLQNLQGSKMWPVNRTAEYANAALALGKGAGIGSGSAHHGSSGVGVDDVRVAIPTSDDIRSSDLSVEAPLRRAMARAIPTEMMRIRRLRDGRGHADLDGGGGVYKGKKANRKNGSGKKSG